MCKGDRTMKLPVTRSKNNYCPRCGKELYIDSITSIVSCINDSCHYTEPCHLRGLEPSPKNCKECPYSPNIASELSFKVLKMLFFSREKERVKKEKGRRNYRITKADLEKLRKELSKALQYPKLKGKCPQAMINEPRGILIKRFNKFNFSKLKGEK